MKKKEEELWIRALKDDGKAFRKLGKRFLEQGRKELAGLCLQKAIERGDEKSFFLYHLHFFSGDQPVDDCSYREMLEEYKQTQDKKLRRQLKKYLEIHKGQGQEEESLL
ncbi:MAG TPA: hypothetical protein IAB31_07115 [Candidatus Choladousia intestinavium]|uniref:Tetratricopeptide repeat protein n=1 Tax=Candidatus Choladousia intestinavium TaxID=2840727 RepID=A0A9D1AC65_9FIRM|nr:hypothetical protein [Candidatus Choladousia intestinavium]